MRVSSLIKHTMSYTFANGVLSLVPFLFAILLTNYISPAEYGVWALFVSLYSFVMPMLGLKLDDAVRMNFLHMEEQDLVKFVGSAVFITTFLSMVTLCIVMMFKKQIAGLTAFPEHWLWAVIVVAHLSSVLLIILSVYQFKNRNRYYSLTAIIQTVITLGFTTLFVLNDFKYSAAILGTMLGTLFAILISTYGLLPRFFGSIYKNFNTKYATELLRFGVLYFPAAMGAVIINLSDRLVIAHKSGLEDTGLFSLAFLFGSVVYALIARSFLTAWLPWAFKYLQTNKKHNINKVIKASLAFYIGMPIVGTVVYFSALVFSPIVFGTSFQNASEYLIWMIALGIANAYFAHNQGFLQYLNRAGIVSIPMIVAIILNILLNQHWIGTQGGIGVAKASIIAYGVASIISAGFALVLFKKQHAQH